MRRTIMLKFIIRILFLIGCCLWTLKFFMRVFGC